MKDRINYLRLALKTLIWIILISLVVLPAAGDGIGKLSLYNWLLPGRDRLPFSDTPQKAYNLSLFNLDAMFASHQISDKSGSADQYRIFILGDSSTWGTLLEPQDTLAGHLNRLELAGPDGKPVRFYNLGYPTMSLTKDLLLLDRALAYEPDLIVWLFTLESFPADKQLTSPLVEHNPRAVGALLDEFGLDPGSYGVEDLSTSFWDRTLFGQRRNLADILRLQLYGIMWGVTGIDQYYPTEYQEAQRDLEEDPTFHDWREGEMTAGQLALEILVAGKDASGDVPVIFVNEPILISEGANSALRYNFYYPRWAYDQYREILNQFSSDHKLAYLDFWDLVPPEEFTNTAIHTTPSGVRMFADALGARLLPYLEP